MKRICENCGEDFNTSPSQVRLRGGKYCSRKCYDEFRTIKKTCIVCGKEFSLGRKHRNNGDNKFCSRQCASLSKIKRIEVECKQCKINFMANPSRKRKFCSRKCQNEYRRGKRYTPAIEKVCEICKKVFIVNHFNHRFCSYKCSCFWLTNIRNKGTNHPRYKGNIKHRYYYPSEFYKVRKKIVNEFNGKCLVCGKPASSVHHIDYDKNNNSSENLVLLCNSCHAKTNTNRDEWEERIRHLTGCW